MQCSEVFERVGWQRVKDTGPPTFMVEHAFGTDKFAYEIGSALRDKQTKGRTDRMPQ